MAKDRRTVITSSKYIDTMIERGWGICCKCGRLHKYRKHLMDPEAKQYDLTARKCSGCKAEFRVIGFRAAEKAGMFNVRRRHEQIILTTEEAEGILRNF